MSDLKVMRERLEYHRSMDVDYIDNIALNEYAALIACAEALKRFQSATTQHHTAQAIDDCNEALAQLERAL